MGGLSPARWFVCLAVALNHDPLYFIECDPITGVVIELGRLGAFVVGDGLGVLSGRIASLTGLSKPLVDALGAPRELASGCWFRSVVASEQG
jgi:hypothetical protein